MELPGNLFPSKDKKQRPADAIVAAEDAGILAAQATAAIDDALGTEWYAEHGNKADRAAHTLCRLRRARAGQWRSSSAGDDAVRKALAEANPEAVVWLASRAISYMDENGYPDTVERYLQE
jgi:hypothetical protein